MILTSVWYLLIYSSKSGVNDEFLSCSPALMHTKGIAAFILLSELSSGRSSLFLPSLLYVDHEKPKASQSAAAVKAVTLSISASD